MYVKKNMAARGAAFFIAALLSVSPCVSWAASSADTTNNEATVNDLADRLLIDTSKKGSLTIHKYDITAAEAAGKYTEGQYKATGESDERVESALKEYAIEGVRFSYLKAGDIEQYSGKDDSGASVVYPVYEIPDALRTILELETSEAVDMSEEQTAVPCTKEGVYHYNSDQINEALKDLLAEDSVKAKDELEEYLYSYGTLDSTTDQAVKNGAVNMTKTDKNGLTSAENLDLGLYLVVETEVPEMVTSTVNPWFVSLPFTKVTADSADAAAGGTSWIYDAVCYPKNQTGNPTLDKSVKNEYDTNTGAVQTGKDFTYGDTVTTSEGNTLDYILVSGLPHISSKATYLSEYTFTDALSKGLTYDQNAKIAIYEKKEDADANATANAVEIWDAKSGNFTQAYAEKTSDDTKEKTGSTMTIKLTEDGLKKINTSYADHYLVVYYTAKVNSDATVTLGDNGNPNDVQLLWSRTSDSYYNSLQDRNYVYTYGLDLVKTFSDNKGDISKVRFRLYNKTDKYYIKAVKKQDGVYYVTGKTKEKSEATEFTPSADAKKLYVIGLEGDSYQLTEVATDDGYTLLKDQIEFTINPTDREIIASVAGTTGLTKADAENIVKNYGGGITNEDGQLVTKAASAFTGDQAVPGPAEETANGRSIGGTDMYVGSIQKASAKVDGVSVTMKNGSSVTADTTSENAEVPLQVVNHKGFLLPQTGGYGLYLVTFLGVLAAGCGCVILRKKEK